MQATDIRLTVEAEVSPVDHVLAAAGTLSARLAGYFIPGLASAGLRAVAAIDPTVYAHGNYARFMQLAASGPRRVLFVGMNPGPHGMAQTGVPFGDVANAGLLLDGRDEIRYYPGLRNAKTGAAWDCKGLAYHRGEQSGQRLWSALSQICGSPKQACARACIVNYCPLYLVDADLKNITPSDLSRRHALTIELETACDEHLQRVVNALDIKTVIAFGGYADKSAHRALASPLFVSRVSFLSVPHPSPLRGSAAKWATDALPILAEVLA